MHDMCCHDEIGDAEEDQGLRTSIREILTHMSLSPQEKNQRVQSLLRQSNGMPAVVNDTTIRVPSELVVPQCKTYHNEAESILGCEHYARQVRIVAPCCNQVFTCRLCHDEQTDHAINRHEIETMVCLHCHTAMPVGPSCSNSQCHMFEKPLAHYFCGECKFFDDDPEKDIYHCRYCGLCRRGQGLEVDFRHCQACNACISIHVFDTHTCIERSLESNCPICHEFMFTSVDPVIFMKCGHAMHGDCFKRYTATNYTCPVCLKSIIDTRDHFEMFSAYVESMEIPEEYQGMRAKILCNDCLARTESDFHFYYHKCCECQSFNTNVISKWHATPEPAS
uniref:RING-type domain-containing protein n=1 Tax=Spongospora subterranea TaxID=70186 RepID=A0A0H5RE46_9EUKA|eukprot:CRZ11812.1 hypothetical protein [Spongospora subterranea]